MGRVGSWQAQSLTSWWQPGEAASEPLVNNGCIHTRTHTNVCTHMHLHCSLLYYAHNHIYSKCTHSWWFSGMFTQRKTYRLLCRNSVQHLDTHTCCHMLGHSHSYSFTNSCTRMLLPCSCAICITPYHTSPQTFFVNKQIMFDCSLNNRQSSKNKLCIHVHLHTHSV